jgi:lipopolysaccharide export system protein LptA
MAKIGMICALGAVLAAGTWQAATAKETTSPFGGGAKSKEPIEVTSDELEVFQMENRAVFTGHVVAIQGDVRLKADQMAIYYNPPKESGDTAKKPAKNAEKSLEKPVEQAPEAASDKAAAKPSAGSADAVKKIEATGSVFLSTPEETASGANGIYDVENNMIYLNDNVVLTRGQNVLKGNHLTYNFTTGKSVLSSKDGNKAAGSGDPVPGKGKQRVRALFVPEGNKSQKQ